MTEKNTTGSKRAERTDVAGHLSKVLADSYSVYLKTHGYHWNVRGPEFFSLHGLLEQQYREIWDALDTLAERIRALDVLAPMGGAAFANLTSIKDGDPEQDAQSMLKELVKDNETLIATARAALEAAEKEGDDPTVDLLTQRLAAHEKAVWMLRSSIA